MKKIKANRRCKKCTFVSKGNPDVCRKKTWKTPKGNEFFEVIEDINERPVWCPLETADKQ